LAETCHALGRRVEPDNAEQVLYAQLITPLREMGLLGSMLPTVEELAGAYRAVPGWRCALVFVLVEAGDVEGAERELAALRHAGFDSIPRDLAWSLATAYLADAAVTLGDVDAAAEVAPLIAPFSGRNASLWDIASHGAVDHHLGRLHRLLGDVDRARRHLEAALALHRRSHQGPMALRSEIELALIDDPRITSRSTTLIDIAERARRAGWVAIAAEATSLAGGSPESTRQS
jgi:hypothetical protein